MIIVDTVLQQREEKGDPIKVGLIGAGNMGKMIALEFLDPPITGMRLAAIANRTIGKAEDAFGRAKVDGVVRADSVQALESAIARNQPVVTDDAMAICKAGNIDVIIDATGTLEFGAHIAMEAIANGKHLVLMNAELDATVGPILKVYADRQGVPYTFTDGDEPGVAMNLYRVLDLVAYKPVMMGQIKGFLNRYRNPETQAEFAKQHGQTPAIVASFADGSKLCLESNLMANATGFRVAVRGMQGPNYPHVKEMLKLYPAERLLEGGIVDYVLNAEPFNGAFVIGYCENPGKMRSMKYLKMGDGPLYMFYTPFHLPHVQIPLSVARAALFNDPTVCPKGAPVCDTVSFAKQDLKAGEVLDGVGGFACYGLLDNYDTAHADNALPIVVSEGCRLKRDIAKDQPITYADVDLPAGRLCDELRIKQNEHFGIAPRKPASAERGRKVELEVG
jgi:predicted homoserine dehydrogenase-like protein